jgi:hypothetical protein
VPKFLAISDAKAGFDSAKTTGRPFVVKFQKADGEIRSMVCVANIPPEFIKGTGDSERDDDMVRVVLSLDRFAEGISDGLQRERAGRQAIRSVRMDSVIRMEAV